VARRALEADPFEVREERRDGWRVRADRPPYGVADADDGAVVADAAGHRVLV
jgi:hypothetical protein